MHRVIRLWTYSSIVLASVAVASVAAGQPGPARTTTPAAAESARPLLVQDLSGGPRAPVRMRAFRADGRPDDATPSVRGIDASWSPDGRTIAYVQTDARDEGKLVLRHVGGRAETLDVVPDGWRLWYRGPVWSPRGDAIGFMTAAAESRAGARRYEIVVVDVARRAIRRRYPIPAPRFDRSFLDKVRWSPDGGSIMVAGDELLVLDLAGGATEKLTDTPAVAEWAPDGRSVYYFPIVGWSMPDSGYRSPPRLRGFFVRRLGEPTSTPLADSARLATIGLKTLPFRFGLAELSPSGRWLALVVGGDGDSTDIRLYQPSDAGPLDVARPERTIRVPGTVTSLEWSPDESRLAAVRAVVPAPDMIGILDLRRGGWTRVPVRIPEDIDPDALFIVRMLSWTR